MKDIYGRTEIEAAVRMLLKVGVFSTRSFQCPLTADEVREIAAELSDAPLVDTVDGWTVVLSSETLAARTLRRIAGVLEVVPHHETLTALVRMIDASSPQAIEFYEATPGVPVLTALLGFLDCDHTEDRADFSTLEDWIEPSEREASIVRILEGTADCNLSTAALIRRMGMAGNRTTFNMKVLPDLPFVAGGKGELIRLLGFFPDAALHRHGEGSSFIGMEQSSCGSRLLLEYRLTEEAVETASFNIAPAAKEAVHGSYFDERSGATIRFNRDSKDARKLTGLRTVINKLFPDYVNGQRAFVLLDKDAGTASVKVFDATDYDGRDAARAWLEETSAPSLAA